MPTILFRPTSFAFDKSHWEPALRAAFGDMDFRVAPEETSDPADIDYIIGWKLEAGDRTRWPNLKAVLALGAGVNQYVGHPDMPENVKLIRMIEPGLAQGMAEYIASMVLRFHKEHDRFAASMAAGAWEDVIPILAQERTVGFMGLGEMAQAAIALLRPVGFDLRGWRRSRGETAGVRVYAGQEERGTFLRDVQILVCLLPLTDETRDILNYDLLSLLPRGAYLINAGRGKHLVEEDLLRLLDEEHLAGAALDVFRKEPLTEGHPFRSHPKIIATPHIAGITYPATGAQALRKAVDEMESGRNPAGLVDQGRGY